MKRTGFSLIELLVVLAVLTVLLSLVSSALRKVKQHSRTVACNANLKQIAIAMLVYEQDNGTFPQGFDDTNYGNIIPPEGYPGSATYDLQGLWWFHFLEDIGRKKGGTVWCPSRNVKDDYVLCGNYGVNRSICKNVLGPSTLDENEFVGQSLSSSHIRQPSSTLLAADSGYSLISWRGCTNANITAYEYSEREGNFYVPGMAINRIRTISPDCQEDAILGRHPKLRVNVLFSDGHTDSVRAEQLFVKESGGKFTNRSPLWTPK